MVDRSRLHDADYRQHIIESLWDEHSKEIRQYCMTRLGSGLAEEVTQEVFVAAWQGLAKYRAEHNLRAWLYGIANNMCRQNYRNRTRRAAIAQTCLEEIRERSHAETPRLLEHQAEAAGQLQQLQNSMARLSDEDRILINLRYWRGLSMQEIASIMNKSSPTIRKRLERAQRRLKEYMSDAEKT